MVEKPSEKRHDGWPLDSISLYRKTLTYFTEPEKNPYHATEENSILDKSQEQIIDFLKSALGIV